MRKKVATIIGIAGYAAILLALYCLFARPLFVGSAELNMVAASVLTAAGLVFGFVFIMFTQSKPAVLGGLLSHIVALIILYQCHSLMYLSVPYIILPFMALSVRGIWGDKLTHTGSIWIEPALLVVAVPLYILELKTNPQLPSYAIYLGLAFLIVNGMVIGDMYIDALKIKGKVKKGVGIAAGQAAPPFCLQNENNENVCLADYTGKHNVLLIFVRGEWCPMCHIMLRTYMKESASFREKNVFLLVVGPDPTGVNKKMAQDLKLDFHILSDPNLRVCHDYRLKIKAKHLLQAGDYTSDKEIPLPASFLIDMHNIIRYCSNPEKIGEVVKLPDIFPVLKSLDTSLQPSA